MTTASIESSLNLVRNKVMGRSGLISAVKEILVGPGEPRIYSASCMVSSVKNYVGAELEGHTGAVGFQWEEAAIGAIGECIERYSCAYCDWDQLIYASKNELGQEAIGLDQFGMYSERQYAHPNFPFAQWDPDKPFYWNKGYSLISGETRYVPAPLVYIPYQVRDRENRSDFLCLSVSTGQAAHTDRTQALLSGLCEVIERDAFMLHWVRKIPPKRVDYMSDPYLRDIYETYFANTNLNFHIFDMTLDIEVPSYLGIAEGISNRGRFICVGAATRPRERDAIVKTLLEAAQGVVWGRDLLRTKPDWRPTDGFVNVRDFEDHVRLFCEPDMVPHADFILNTNRSCKLEDPDRSFESPKAALDFCLEKLKRLGLDAIVIDTTSPEVAELGFYVPKVFIPTAVPLTAIHGLPAYGSPRYQTVPKKFGFTEGIHSEFNPIPHPFP